MRTLTLRKEVLAQLTDSELGAVAGGAVESGSPCWTPPHPTAAVTCLATGVVDTLTRGITGTTCP